MKNDLVALGLPVRAPGGGGSSLPTGAIGGIAAGAVAFALLILAALRLAAPPSARPGLGTA